LVGKIITLLENHINDEDARKDLAGDFFDVFSHCKLKETPEQLALKSQA